VSKSATKTVVSRVLAAILLMLAALLFAHSQSTTATLTATVSDQSG